MSPSDVMQEEVMNSVPHDCILIVDSNPDFRERLAQEFRSASYNVFTAGTGEEAFLILRRRPHQIGWLFSRAALSGLIDGWVLADEYHQTHPSRPVVISAHDTRFTARGDIVLREPAVDVVSEAIWDVIGSIQPDHEIAAIDLSERRRAA
jgi:DNA-binding NtrC family response regulator